MIDTFYDSPDPNVKNALQHSRIPSYPRHVIFVMHLPPGMKSRRRQFPLDYLLAHSVSFLDDLRPSVNGTVSVEDMLFKSLHELHQENRLNLWAKVETLYVIPPSRLWEWGVCSATHGKA